MITIRINGTEQTIPQFKLVQLIIRNPELEWEYV